MGLDIWRVVSTARHPEIPSRNSPHKTGGGGSPISSKAAPPPSTPTVLDGGVRGTPTSGRLDLGPPCRVDARVGALKETHRKHPDDTEAPVRFDGLVFSRATAVKAARRVSEGPACRGRATPSRDAKQLRNRGVPCSLHVPSRKPSFRAKPPRRTRRSRRLGERPPARNFQTKSGTGESRSGVGERRIRRENGWENMGRGAKVGSYNIVHGIFRALMTP